MPDREHDELRKKVERLRGALQLLLEKLDNHGVLSADDVREVRRLVRAHDEEELRPLVDSALATSGADTPEAGPGHPYRAAPRTADTCARCGAPIGRGDSTSYLPEVGMVCVACSGRVRG
jgi:glycine/D-amino acid oxidase-like deaminating enzyme